MNIPQPLETGDFKGKKELTKFAIKYGKIKIINKKTYKVLDFSSYEYIGTKDQCTAIPKAERQEYRTLLFTWPILNMVCEGVEYSVEDQTK